MDVRITVCHSAAACSLAALRQPEPRAGGCHSVTVPWAGAVGARPARDGPGLTDRLAVTVSRAFARPDGSAAPDRHGTGLCIPCAA